MEDNVWLIILRWLLTIIFGLLILFVFDAIITIALMLLIALVTWSTSIFTVAFENIYLIIRLLFACSIVTGVAIVMQTD